MSDDSVLVELPKDLYERIHQVAVESNRPVEAVVADSLALLFGHEREEIEPEHLTHFNDEQLWGIVYQHLAWPQDARLRELTALGKQKLLSDSEKRELEQLIDRVDRYVLLRSQALLFLKQRGHDVDQRLKLGA